MKKTTNHALKAKDGPQKANEKGNFFSFRIKANNVFFTQYRMSLYSERLNPITALPEGGSGLFQH